MERKLYTREDVVNFIGMNRHMVLTGDESLLSALPVGNWIGGTIPYFMDVQGGIFTKDKIFVDDFTSLGIDFRIIEFDEQNISGVATSGFRNGFTILLIPGESGILQEFAMNADSYPGIFRNPITGYVTGNDLNETNATPKVFNGTTAKCFSDKAIGIHVELPAAKIARVEIVNIFRPVEKADIITFPVSGFNQTKCFVNGEERLLIEYLDGQKYDTQFPLIVNQAGAYINKSFRMLNKETKEVKFFAPLLTGEKYMLAQKVEDYGARFEKEIGTIPQTEFVCNCILNHLYGKFEGKKINLNWKTTFGEVAYQLLNQTLVYLTIDEMEE
ncbi:MAG: hypothetical protein NTU44_10885 [Bacteroidetes bacterium]|nr:hypothetical protein [Bacteroidota bacterium]